MLQISLCLLIIYAENWPWRAKIATLKQCYEGDVILFQATA
jgi:hypothetical protein